MSLEKLKKHSLRLGLAFTIASMAVCFALTWIFFEDDVFVRMQKYLFDCGVDVMGAFTCAALYYGTMRQEGEGAKTFRTLNVMVSAAFLVNALMYYTTGVPELAALNFAFVLLSKLLDLALIYFFYLYVWVTLDFEGKLARWAAKGLPVLLALEALVILSNLFHPFTFQVDADGFYHAAAASAAWKG